MQEEHNTYELPNLEGRDENFEYDIPSEFTPASVSTSVTPCQDKSKLKKPVCNSLWMCALVGFILVGSTAFASLALTAWNSSQVSSISECKSIIKQLQNSLNDTTSELERIMHIQNSLSDRIEQLSYSLFGRDSINPASSCSQILLNPSSPSGHYWIRSSNGSAVRVYCDFNRQCGCDGPSGWTRVAFLNMSDPNQVCPSNWTYISSPVRTCGKGQTSRDGCDSVFYSTFRMTYTRVCGRIIAYQDGIPDAFDTGSDDINEIYIDGVSLTHDNNGSRQHIWSFVSAAGEAISSSFICACSSSNPWPHSTSFVGDDYFCDSGNHANTLSTSTFYSGDPLWDGQGCGPSSSCCQFNNPPWFCKTLPQSTTGDLEVRICKNFNDEDIPIQLVELYVQ